MARRPYFIPKAAIKNIFRKAGVKRVSEEAVVFVREQVEELVRKLAEMAQQYAQHAGRKSVKKSDVKLAWEALFEKK